MPPASKTSSAGALESWRSGAGRRAAGRARAAAGATARRAAVGAARVASPGQLRAIVGVELVVDRIEAKFKLSQNRPEADIDGVVAGLRAEANEEDSAGLVPEVPAGLILVPNPAPDWDHAQAGTASPARGRATG